MSEAKTLSLYEPIHGVCSIRKKIADTLFVCNTPEYSDLEISEDKAFSIHNHTGVNDASRSKSILKELVKHLNITINSSSTVTCKELIYSADGEAQLEDIDLGESVTQSFSWNDFLYSATAKARNINNNPTETHKQNLIRLAKTLEDLQTRFGKKIVISSGYRSPALNAAVPGASKTSDHSHGAAADIKTESDTFAANLHLLKAVCDFNEEYKENNGTQIFKQIIWEFGSDAGPDWVHVAIQHSGVTKATRYTRAYGSPTNAKYVDTAGGKPFVINT